VTLLEGKTGRGNLPYCNCIKDENKAARIEAKKAHNHVR
jgi:hypothetical protein